MRMAGKTRSLRRPRLTLLVVGLFTAAMIFEIYCGMRGRFEGSIGSKDLRSINRASNLHGVRLPALGKSEGETGVRIHNTSSQAAINDAGRSTGVFPGLQRQQTAGTLPPLLAKSAASPPHVNAVRNSRKYHTITTTQSFYHHWQARVRYYWFKKQKVACEAANGVESCDIGGFTRLLHSGHADDLMDEIPTVVVDMMPGARSNAYPPLNRPYAFLQWLDKAKIPERYIMMAERTTSSSAPCPT